MQIDKNETRSQNAEESFVDNKPIDEVSTESNKNNTSDHENHHRVPSEMDITYSFDRNCYKKLR